MTAAPPPQPLRYFLLFASQCGSGIPKETWISLMMNNAMLLHHQGLLGSNLERRDNDLRTCNVPIDEEAVLPRIY